MFNSKGVLPIGPQVVPLTVFTFSDFFYHVNFIRTFCK